jgi:hypothetical protein
MQDVRLLKRLLGHGSAGKQGPQVICQRIRLARHLGGKTFLHELGKIPPPTAEFSAVHEHVPLGTLVTGTCTGAPSAPILLNSEPEPIIAEFLIPPGDHVEMKNQVPVLAVS